MTLPDFLPLRDCELLQVCRGCRAVGCNVTGELRGPDPMCWKERFDVRLTLVDV